MTRLQYIVVYCLSLTAGALAFYALEPSVLWALVFGALFGVAVVFWTLGLVSRDKDEPLIPHLISFVWGRSYWVAAVVAGANISRMDENLYHNSHRQSLIHGYMALLLIALGLEILFHYMYEGSRNARNEGAGCGCGCFPLMVFLWVFPAIYHIRERHHQHQAHPVKQEQR